MEGPRDLLGLQVWGSGGDTGFTREGCHAEFINIPAAAVCRRPQNLTAEEAASVGVPFVTAFSAFALAHLESGQWVIVSGAAGAVGRAMVIYSVAFGGREVTLDLFALYRHRHQLFGLGSEAIDVVHGAKVLSELTPLFESGKLGKPHIAERYPLIDGVRAYERVATANGKVVLQIGGWLHDLKE